MLNLRSKLRRKLFRYSFTNPQANHHLRELARLLAVDPANLSRELAALGRQGIFISEVRGRQKFFRLNREHPLYDDFRRIVFKTIGVVGQLRDALAKVQHIESAHLYGSFARDQADARSDVDVLIVGKPRSDDLEETIRTLERRLHREIHYVVLTPKEFEVRRKGKDAFLQDVWKQRRVALFGNEKAEAANR